MTNKQTVVFGDIATQIMERVTPSSDDSKTFIGLEHLKPGYFFVHDWGSDISLKTQAFKVKSGDIIFSRRNTYLKRISVSQINGICSADAMVIRPIENEALIEGYLPHLMQSTFFMDKVIANSAGSLSSRVKWNELSQLEVTIPTREQQIETLNVLDSIAKKELMYMAGIKSANKLLYALGLRVFDNYFDARKNKRVKLPSDWSEVSIKSILKGTPESGFSPVEVPNETGKYVLNLNSLSKTGFRETTLKKISEEHFNKGRVCQADDLYISRSNTAELVGLVGKFSSSQGVGQTIFPDTMWRLNVNQKLMKQDFLMYYLMSPYGRRSIQSIAAGTSGSMKKINKDGFSKLKVPLPPLEIQSKIIATFEQAYSNIWCFNHSLRKTLELRQAIIDKDL